MIKITPNRRELNEQGIVSITVTMVFILVISLTVLGFSQVVQRNSRQALDRQLGEIVLEQARVEPLDRDAVL